MFRRPAPSRASRPFGTPFRPSVEQLEDRLAPAVLDLRTLGSSGEINGALFLQYDPAGSTGTGNINAFLQIHNDITERGYNTTGAVEFDTGGASAVQLTSLPTVTIGGIEYVELLLDINEPGSVNYLSLQELRIFLGSTGNLTGFPTFNNQAVEVFNMDVGPDGDSRVDLNAGLTAGSGAGDLIALIPASLFDTSTNPFLYVYSRLGLDLALGGFASDGGFEEWAFSGEGPLTPLADLSLTKSVDNAAPLVGATITFTIALTNSGPDTASGVAVADPLPAGLSLVSAGASQGNYDGGTGTWTVGTLDPGAVVTLTIAATVTAAGALVNTAQVSASGALDPDSTPNNNVAGEDDQASVTVQVRVLTADLRVTKIVRPRQVITGQVATFTLIVRNVGPDAAANVVLTDRLPAGLRFISASPTQGTYESSTGTWTIGTLESGAQVTLRLTVRVTAPGPIRNVATVTSDTFDPNRTNNRSVAWINSTWTDLSKRLLLGSTVW
jgi:uncharacterized repeat protein (TIGR01451 family)